VEEELNGFFTYDRQIRKMDFARVRDVHLRVLGAASGSTLSLNKPVSLRVTTPGYTDRYLRHRDGAARTDVINAASPTADKQDATFFVRAGLSNGACYSFESRNFPGRYLRHRAYRVYSEANNGGTFAADATFCARPGLSGGGTSLESANLPGYFMRHRSEEVWMDANNGGSFTADATWGVSAGWWRSGADLPVGQRRSFRVTTPGYETRYLRHRDGLARTDVITSTSAATDRLDATFIVRAGLAESSCFSLESANFPGQYLRHANYRLQKSSSDGSVVFQQDATFCAQQPLNGGAGNVSLESFNYPGCYVRHRNEEVWIDPNSGGSLLADATWNNAAPLG
jgi:hypothetical protein